MVIRHGVLGAAVMLSAGGVLAAQQAQGPDGWRWALDAPARLMDVQDVPDSGWRFTPMPPGYHVTMGPGGVLYHPSAASSGRYAVEAETFFFPGRSLAEMGVFVEGAALESSTARYTAFVIRRDGQAAAMVVEHGERRFVVPWTRHDSIAVQEAGNVVRNLLRVEADSAGFTFLVNGQRVLGVSRASATVGERFGFRVGQGINLHASSLDLITHLAPARRR